MAKITLSDGLKKQISELIGLTWLPMNLQTYDVTDGEKVGKILDFYSPQKYQFDQMQSVIKPLILAENPDLDFGDGTETAPDEEPNETPDETPVDPVITATIPENGTLIISDVEFTVDYFTYNTETAVGSLKFVDDETVWKGNGEYDIMTIITGATAITAVELSNEDMSGDDTNVKFDIVTVDEDGAEETIQTSVNLTMLGFDIDGILASVEPASDDTVVEPTVEDNITPVSDEPASDEPVVE